MFCPEYDITGHIEDITYLKILPQAYADDNGHNGENKAFVGLGICDNVQNETSIFKYANWPRLQA